MNLLYTRLFNLRMAHNYYADGLVKDLRIMPTLATQKILRDGRMLFKTIPSGAVVLYKTLDDEVTPFVDLGKTVRLTFFLTVESKSVFYTITDLDESPVRKFSSANVVYFKNDPASASIDPANPEDISHTLIDSVREPLFTYAFPLNAGPAEVLLRIKDEDNALVSVGKDTEGVPFPTTLNLPKGSDGAYRQQIDLRDKPVGRYTLTVRDLADSNTLKEEIIYVSAELTGKEIMGIVDIRYETPSDHIYHDTEEYRLQFIRKETIWKYYVVDKNGKVDLVTHDLLISDTGPGGGNPYQVNNFVREGAEPHADIRINDLDTVVFKSDTPIPFFETPKLGLELRKNPGDQQVVINLPNPSHKGIIKEDMGNPASEIYVFI